MIKPATALSNTAASPISTTVRLADERGAVWVDARLQMAILSDSRSPTQAVRAMLDPRFWAQRGRMDATRGGRNAVCFVETDIGLAVIRHYRRGGVIGRFNRDLYLWTGEDRTRCFREFHLLQTLCALGLPVPIPLATGYSRVGLAYRADLMTVMIPNAQPLALQLPRWVTDVDIGRRLGRLVALFHGAGVFHADLNAFNVLINDEGELWLVDFDRCRLQAWDKHWPQANLRRLRRSLHKLGVLTGGVSAAQFDVFWRAVLQGYVEQGAISIGRDG